MTSRVAGNSREGTPSAAGGEGAPIAGAGGLTKVQRVVLGLVILTGIALRAVRYGHHFPLWLDEIMLSLNIVQRSFAGLMRPLDDNQAAPVGYLMLAKLAVLALGRNEWALRLPTFLAGVVSVPLAWAVFRRCLEAWPAIGALALIAFSRPLIQHGAEAKQYGMDVAVTLTILLAVMRWMERPERAGRWVLLVAACVAGIFLSHPAYFLILSLLVYLGWQGARRRCVASTAHWIVALWVICGLVMLVNYLLFLRPVARNPFLLSSNSMGFLQRPTRKSPWSPLVFDANLLVEQARNVVGPGAPVPALALIIGGLVTLRRWQMNAAVWILAMAFGVTLEMSFTGKFPLLARYSLPLVAFYCLCIGGLVQVLGQYRRVGLGLASAAMVLIAAWSLAGTTRYLVLDDGNAEDFAALFAELGQKGRAGEAVYLHSWVEPGYAFYGRQCAGMERLRVVEDQLDDDLRVQLNRSRGPADCEAVASAIPAGTRVWVVMTELHTEISLASRSAIIKTFELHGIVRDVIQVRNAFAMEFEMGKR